MVQASDRRRLDELIQALERENLVEDPANHLETVAGRWKLMYTTITVRVGNPQQLREMECAGRLGPSLASAAKSLGLLWKHLLDFFFFFLGNISCFSLETSLGFF